MAEEAKHNDVADALLLDFISHDALSVSVPLLSAVPKRHDESSDPIIIKILFKKWTTK